MSALADLKQRIAARLDGLPRIMASPKPGKATAEFVERAILAPAERFAPDFAPVANIIRRCGVCPGEAKRLDGDGGGSTV
jgi:hypothetical protein